METFFDIAGPFTALATCVQTLVVVFLVFAPFGWTPDWAVGLLRWATPSYLLFGLASVGELSAGDHHPLYVMALAALTVFAWWSVFCIRAEVAANGKDSVNIRQPLRKGTDGVPTQE